MCEMTNNDAMFNTLRELMEGLASVHRNPEGKIIIVATGNEKEVLAVNQRLFGVAPFAQFQAPNTWTI